MKKQFVLINMLAALLLLLAACGGAELPAVEEPAAAAPTNTPAPALEPVEPAQDEAEPEPVAEATEEPATEAPTSEETAVLLPLPRLDSAPTTASFGGGGIETVAETSALSVAEDVALTRPFFPNVFSQTNFILNTTLPLQPTSAIVEQQHPQPINADQATLIAQQFGFNGPLYQELFPSEGVEQPFLPTIFRAFDGQTELTIDTFGIYYRNNAAQDNIDYLNPLPLEQRTAAAEAFLQARGLLTFPYIIQDGFGADVQFMRQLNNFTIEAPVFNVTINNAGEVAYLYYQPATNLQELGSYPLRSAEEAWQLIQAGIQENNIPFIIQPNFDDVATLPVEEPSFVNDIRFWNREYSAGEEAHLYGWPTIFVPVSGEGAPRINLWPLNLAGDEAQLNSIVELFGQNIHVWGTISADGQTLQVAGWESLEDATPLSLEGTIVRDGDTVRLDTIEGDSYLLPNAPADLDGGISVYLFAWAARDTGQQFPVLDWENIDEAFVVGETGIVEPIEEPLLVDPLPGEFEEPSYAEVTINEVTLIYTQMPFFNDMVGEDAVEGRDFEPPTFVNQPVWKFSGTTDTGESVALFVQAVAPELIGTP